MTASAAYATPRSLRALLVALVGALSILPTVGAGGASAAAWAPVASQRLPSRVSDPHAVFSSRGSGLLVARPIGHGGRSASGFEDAVRVQRVDPSGTLGADFRLPASRGVIQGGALARGRALVEVPPARPGSPIHVGELSASGRVSRVQRIAAPDHVAGAPDVVCTSTRGDAVVVWTERSGRGSLTLAMARRPAAGRVSARAALTTTTPFDIACAVGPSGRWAIVAAVRRLGAEDDTPVLRAWTGTVGSGARRRVDLGPAPYATSADVAIDGTGRAYVVARDQLPGTDFYDDTDAEPFRVRTATIAPDGRSATPMRTVLGGIGRGGYATVMASPAAGALMQVTGSAAGVEGDALPPSISFATAGAGGDFGPLAPVGEGAAYRGPAAYLPDGTAILTWTTVGDGRTPRPLFATPVAGDGTVGPPEATGLFGPDGAFLAPTASGQPRLLRIVTTARHSTLRSVERIGP